MRSAPHLCHPSEPLGLEELPDGLLEGDVGQQLRAHGIVGHGAA